MSSLTIMSGYVDSNVLTKVMSTLTAALDIEDYMDLQISECYCVEQSLETRTLNSSITYLSPIDKVYTGKFKFKKNVYSFSFNESLSKFRILHFPNIDKDNVINININNLSKLI